MLRMRCLSVLVVLVVLIVPVVLSGGCDDYTVCPVVEPETLADTLPARLSDTGIAAGRAFAPAFELWSDGASKRRFIALPEGTQIDTSDMDDWKFPVGTKLWKEFTRDGVVVETRLLQRIGEADDAWAAAAYIHDGDDATLRALGAVDARGTSHDVPSADRCMGCHAGRASRVLGFSAVQLSRANITTPREGDLDLDALVAEDLLSDPPATAPVVPGDDVTRRALGYVHANCSHCHNQTRPDRVENLRCYDPDNELDFTLDVDDLATGDRERTAFFRTAIGDASVGKPFARGDVQESFGILLMNQRDPRLARGGEVEQMPPLATEVVDDEGVAALRVFIESL
jgi:hypothetical protein